jgi:hypothetical protein
MFIYFFLRSPKALCGQGVAVKENQKIICHQKYFIIILKTHAGEGKVNQKVSRQDSGRINLNDDLIRLFEFHVF